MKMPEFKRLVHRVMDTLPQEFYPYLDNLSVEVEEEPDDDFLRDAGFTEEEIEDGETLFGFFEPIDLPLGDALETGEWPNRIWIFKRPHEEEFEDPRELRLEIRKTVIHELAHHFGFSEADLDRFESVKDPFGDDFDYGA
jgi:predicted Zn-dependent protease with MMP-like domain